MVDQQFFVAVIERAVAVVDAPASAAVVEHALDVLVEEDVFDVVARRAGTFERRTGKYV
ncbi:hypothetical protein MAGR_25030 [Mycolicibacterium agri]|uniref:Uncharacterized protein n=1 Tax=Mycolicibacterium agri TaxID=36811 RepID=A0A7I9W021_MYCAG|nr:hypothetical protein MAGR_25030 [Mycolicibacterium agri]